jgi:hypothetical protein
MVLIGFVFVSAFFEKKIFFKIILLWVQICNNPFVRHFLPAFAKFTHWNFNSLSQFSNSSSVRASTRNSSPYLKFLKESMLKKLLKLLEYDLKMEKKIF